MFIYLFLFENRTKNIKYSFLCHEVLKKFLFRTSNNMMTDHRDKLWKYCFFPVTRYHTLLFKISVVCKNIFVFASSSSSATLYCETNVPPILWHE